MQAFKTFIFPGMSLHPSMPELIKFMGELQSLQKGLNFKVFAKFPLVAEDLVFKVAAFLLTDLKTVVVSFYRAPTGELALFLDNLHFA